MLMTINLKQSTLVEISSRKRYGNKLKFNPVLGWLVRRSRRVSMLPFSVQQCESEAVSGFHCLVHRASSQQGQSLELGKDRRLNMSEAFECHHFKTLPVVQLYRFILQKQTFLVCGD